MAPKSGSVPNEPRRAVEIAASIKNCRDLIRIADQQIEKAHADLGVARQGLIDIEAELTVRGIGVGKGGRVR